MNIRKISLLVLCALLAALSSVPAFAADKEGTPLYAADIQNGVYENVAVDSTSSMFRVIACTLTVTDEGMTAHMTLSGQGFGKLYLGRGEAARGEDESAFYPFGDDGEGHHTFDIPVEALDKPLPCAGWSIKREEWFDRDITFRSDSLPEGAVIRKAGASWLPVAAASAAVIVLGAAFAFFAIRKKKS